MQGQEEDQSSQVEDNFPQKKVATESGTTNQSGGPLGKPHTSESAGAREAQVDLRHLRGLRRTTYGFGKNLHRTAGARHL
eukprot:5707801-Heterocapsa_arctica.AAC.1